MPCILKIRIVAARDLPVMDRTSELTDAYITLRFADYEVQRTQICRKTLCPTWNEDFRFEVSDDADLQNEPLELKVLDYDAITANDAVGTVIIDLNPLLAWDSSGMISGWFPIYDTLRGIRGELNIQVKLLFFGDLNPFKDSSAGVQFFSVSDLSSCYRISAVRGFVDALVMEDDPEYHWSDSFRTPRTSNETRQRLLFQMSGKLRRLLGLKVLEMGGNVVIAYQESIDLEAEERSITLRGIGTACTVESLKHDFTEPLLSMPSPALSPQGHRGPSLENLELEERLRKNSLAETKESLKEDASSEMGESRFKASVYNGAHYVPFSDQQILTLNKFPANVVMAIGGIVSARSVKLIVDDSPVVRQSWWDELRADMKGHARVMGCQHIVGYQEYVTISDELCVLSAVGTAADIDIALLEMPTEGAKYENVAELLQSKRSLTRVESHSESRLARKLKKQNMKCRACHIPYNSKNKPFPMNVFKCGICGKGYVPEILLSTAEQPLELDSIGHAVHIEAHVCRQKKNKEGESNATIVSEILPFVEYDIHRQLMYKLRIHGMNAIFDLRIQLTVGDSLVAAVAMGSGVYLSALPTPPALKISRNIDVVDDEDVQLLALQRRIMEISEQNRSRLDSAYLQTRLNNQIAPESSIESDEEVHSESDESESDNDLANQYNLVVQIDDDTDEDLLVVLLDPQFPHWFHLSKAEHFQGHMVMDPPIDIDSCIATTLKMITVLKKSIVHHSEKFLNRRLAFIFRELYNELLYQLAVFAPCSVNGIDFNVELLEEGEVQLRLSAMIITYGKATSATDQVFHLEVDEEEVKTQEMNDEQPVFIPITPLSYLLNSTVVDYIGHLSLHFVKEVHIAAPSPENKLINSNLGGFTNLFLIEVQAIARAHTIAMGGNAILAFRIDKCEFSESIKGQCYGLLSVSGDVVCVKYVQGRAAEKDWEKIVGKCFT